MKVLPPAEQPKKPPYFNRTKLELKGDTLETGNAQMFYFNRTKLELKGQNIQDIAPFDIDFNRTKLELKVNFREGKRAENIKL